MSRRSSASIAPADVAFMSVVSGCSSVTTPIVASHSRAVGVQETPQSAAGWTLKAPMPTAREALTASVVDGTLYAVGGFDDITLTTVEAYSPVTDTWTTKAPMPTPRFFLASGVINGILYAVGGDDVNVNALNKVET